MKLSDFDYEIPADRIAQHPLEERDRSKLFILHKETGRFEHAVFNEITGYLAQDDLLVLNDTRVIPVRLYGKKPSGGKAEITLIKELGLNSWEALVKGLNEGRIVLGSGITANVFRINGASARVEFSFNPKTAEVFGDDIKNVLNELGAMPLPVYIKRNSETSDHSRYQTVYAKNRGAVAAPTAGLHFTDRLIDEIKAMGVEVRTVTHHVGYGTFRPVTSDNIKEHKMDEESFIIPQETADAVNSAKADGRRIIAVGTTVTRALEASAAERGDGKISAGQGRASIFITPGHEFKIITALLTNFHTPKSTPMMLAASLCGLETLKMAYQESQKTDYRYFSYGDAMLII